MAPKDVIAECLSKFIWMTRTNYQDIQVLYDIQHDMQYDIQLLNIIYMCVHTYYIYNTLYIYIIQLYTCFFRKLTTHFRLLPQSLKVLDARLPFCPKGPFEDVPKQQRPVDPQDIYDLPPRASSVQVSVSSPNRRVDGLEIFGMINGDLMVI